MQFVLSVTEVGATHFSHRTAKFLTPEWPMKNGDCWNFYGFLPSAGHALMVSMGAILRKLAIENHLAVLVPFFLFLCQSLCEQLSTSSHWSSSGQYQMLGNHCAWLGADGSCETCEVCLDMAIIVTKMFLNVSSLSLTYKNYYSVHY
jgi:hypothetical protein